MGTTLSRCYCFRRPFLILNFKSSAFRGTGEKPDRRFRIPDRRFRIPDSRLRIANFCRFDLFRTQFYSQCLFKLKASASNSINLFAVMLSYNTNFKTFGSIVGSVWVGVETSTPSIFPKRYRAVDMFSRPCFLNICDDYMLCIVCLIYSTHYYLNYESCQLIHSCHLRSKGTKMVS